MITLPYCEKSPQSKMILKGFNSLLTIWKNIYIYIYIYLGFIVEEIFIGIFYQVLLLEYIGFKVVDPTHIFPNEHVDKIFYAKKMLYKQAID
jgi:hypothetical protein